MPLEIPTPDDILELFRDEIVVREAPVDVEYESLVDDPGGEGWVTVSPGLERLTPPGKPMVLRVSFRRLLGPTAFNEIDRIRHDLRQLWNEIRAAIPSESQAEFVAPRVTHVDRPAGIEVTCYTHGIVRTF